MTLTCGLGLDDGRDWKWSSGRGRLLSYGRDLTLNHNLLMNDFYVVVGIVIDDQTNGVGEDWLGGLVATVFFS